MTSFSDTPQATSDLSHVIDTLPEAVTDITLDSRQVRAGSLFIALPGSRVDGAAYAREAAEKGAAAILLSADTPDELIPTGPQILKSQTPHADAARLAAAFFAPGPDKSAAVTGTNGKTSVTWFARQMLEMAGKKAVSVGTLGLMPDSLGALPSLTSPDPVSLHRTLHHARGQGYDHLVIEASSHGLDQHRLDGLALDVMAFTNLTQDHLDYHKSMDAYRQAKLRLLTLAAARGQVITNADDPSFSDLSSGLGSGLRVWSYGGSGEEGKILTAAPTTTGLHLVTPDFDHEVPFIGGFQGHNLVCAWLMARALGVEAGDFLPELTAVPGRMQAVAKRQDGGLALIDYAHTPDALASALKAARAHTPARVICVLGAGGNRDQGKRPLMGQAAATLADICIVSDDNPRFEDPASIRGHILAACPDGIEIADRRAAIAHALDMAGAGDLVLIAGKGHESGQTTGSTTRPFDDRDVTRDLAGQTSVWTPLP